MIVPLLFFACSSGPELTSAVPAAEAAKPAAAELGAPAPAFTLPSVQGAQVSLSDYAGKTVVLEWFNPDCPFVKFAHGADGPLRSLPKRWTDQGVVWLAINSGAPGKQGAGLERNKAALAEYSIDYPVLLDEPGAVGRAYAAKTTPHIFIVSPSGALVYRGGLDNAPMGKAPAEGAVDHTSAALDDLLAGRPVATPETKAYGCSVKYAD